MSQISRVIGGDFVDSDTMNDLLFCWGLWAGTDESYIKKYIGHKSQLGTLIKKNNIVAERTSEIRKSDLISYYPESLYQKVDAARRNMNPADQLFTDIRYRYQFPRRVIREKISQQEFDRRTRNAHSQVANAIGVIIE